ncbi:FAD-dependent oxidoreductase [Paraeggerthella hongkongensis]|uniref:FAD-binding dehydrogenase n=1 Tax=Paraeggerthella hongkongensis TaxID=230658 RepID=A0A3N0B0Z8_9ACTN|nr:FAD-dependent oxidoreductase [Paraeggerthella hongkongensis]RNL40775.1 FAD-binding dehydrogenase [Paraeggerthella hongkongensis]
MAKQNKNQGISRRDLLKFGGMTAAGIAAASTLGACSPQGTAAKNADSATAKASEKTTAAGHLRTGIPSFLEKPAAITNIATTKEYDVVVVGAGASGVPAALSALEAGARVALLQKEQQAISQGNSGSGIDLATSDQADIEDLVSQLMADNQHRPNRALIELWAKNSGEAVSWVIEKAAESGAQVVDQGNQQHMPLINRKGYTMNFVTSFFGPKPYNTGDGMRALATTAEKEGVEIFYSTPAEQLVQNESGKVVGVIAKGKDGYVQFNASKGVIIACGDYQNDEDMLHYYQPDMTNFQPKQSNKTGDGHKMVVWAGGKIENLAHTKMLHDFDAGPASMCDMPFLSVKMNGERFVNETVEMSLMNCYLRSAEDAGHYCQVFDSSYMTAAADWPGKLVNPEALKTYMPEENVERTGVFEGQINTFKADTLEELAKKLGITDTATFTKTIAHYNDLAASGKDVDFGKAAKFLAPIDTPPYYGIHRHVRMSAICSGVDINENHECLTPEGEIIENLYAIGNCSGHFYGGIDYPLTVFGLSLGRCYTEGYVIGRMVAQK